MNRYVLGIEPDQEEEQESDQVHTVLEQVVASAFGDVDADGLALSQVLVVAHAIRGRACFFFLKNSNALDYTSIIDRQDFLYYNKARERSQCKVQMVVTKHREVCYGN